jgi:hypothetical protein
MFIARTSVGAASCRDLRHAISQLTAFTMGENDKPEILMHVFPSFFKGGLGWIFSFQY